MTCDTLTDRLEYHHDTSGVSAYLLNEAGTLRLYSLGDWWAPASLGTVNDGPDSDDNVGADAASYAEWRWLNTGRDWKPGGSREDCQRIETTEPAPAVTGKSGGQWWLERPATTVQGDPRIWPPGHKINAGDVDRLGQTAAQERYGDRAGTDAVRVTLAEALVLQGFPPDYPVAGNVTESFQQVGDAIPPQLARAVLAALLG